MITFIFGNHASGKTTKILDMIATNAKGDASDIKSKAHTFLIVPNQETLQIERMLSSMPNAPSPLNFEVLSFSRLYNRACREYGNITYSYITNPIKYLLMWKTIRDLRSSFSKIKVQKDYALEDSLITTVNELKANGISAEDLKNEKLEKFSSELAKKANDIAEIYTNYNNAIAKNYSDSADDLSRLCDLLNEHDFFKGSNVFIDSFTSFTAVQYRVIEKIFSQAENVIITIPIAKSELNAIDTKSIKQSYERLYSAAKKYNQISIIDLPDRLNEAENSIFFLSKKLWTLDVLHDSVKHTFDSNIVYESCDTPYAEAEAVCAHIRALLAKGARCRDMAIIARDAESYRGIIDQALIKSKIPFYFSESYDLCSSVVVKFLISALRISLYNWQKGDVISYVKTGLCDVSQNEKNLFEEYVNTWNIHGRQFLEEYWNMNPDGVSSTLSPRANEILIAANNVRATIVPTLERFFILLKQANTVDEMCRQVYKFLVDTNIEEKLRNLTLRASQQKDLKAMRETGQTFEIVLNSLADIGVALSGESASVEEFISILLSVFRKTQINTIPTSIDEVTVVSADTMRLSNPKYVFVIGLCEGKFPAIVKDNGFFSFADKSIFANVGIQFNSTADTRSSDELMYVKRSFSAPSEKLYVFTHKVEIDGSKCFPSLAFSRINALFNIKPNDFSMTNFDYLIPAPKNVAITLQTIKNPKVKEILIEALTPYISGIEKYSPQSIKASTETINAKVSTTLKNHTESIHLSPSKFEKYAKCPFNYFCSEILNLREQKKADFGLDNIGSFIHKILEDVIKYIFTKLENGEDVIDEDILSKTEITVKSYLEAVCPTQLLTSPRLLHLYKRLEKLSILLTKNILTEFSESDFKPTFFELKINGNNNNGNPNPPAFKLNDGTVLTLGGTIDRVDIYKKDSTIYVKIIDYKTGAKKFTLDDLQSGQNTQMLIYLYAICKNESQSFKKLLSEDPNQKIKPAGIVYFSANVSPITSNNYLDENATAEKIQDEIKRNGILLSEEDILTAMNHSFNSTFLLGTKKNKNGELSGNSLASSENFDEIFTDLENVIKKIATNLNNGVVSANPIKSEHSPCEYCQSKPVCRNVQK